MTMNNRVSLDAIELLLQTLRHKGIHDNELKVELSGSTPHLADLLEAVRIVEMEESRDEFRARLGLPPRIMPTLVNYDLITMGLIADLTSHFHGPNLSGWNMPTVSITGQKTLKFTLKLYFASLENPVTLDQINRDARKFKYRQANLHEFVVWSLANMDFVRRSKMSISATGASVDMPAGRNEHFRWTPSLHKRSGELCLSYSAAENRVATEDFLELFVVE